MAVLDLSFAGRPFRLDSADGTDLVARGMVDGSFEAPLPIMVMAMLCRVDGIFIDVGANSGLYSVLAGVTRPGMKVIAFEPFPAAIAVCEKNIRLNGLDSAVVMRKVALGDRSGTSTLYIPDPSHGLLESSCSLEKSFKSNNSDSIEVRVRTMDELDIWQKIAVIKADIEGHEHAFLAGAQKTIARDRPIVFIEVLSAANFPALRAFLSKNDYIDFRLRPDMAIQDDDIRFDSKAWNHALVPENRIAEFRDACRTHGLEMVRRLSVNGP